VDIKIQKKNKAGEGKSSFFSSQKKARSIYRGHSVRVENTPFKHGRRGNLSGVKKEREGGKEGWEVCEKIFFGKGEHRPMGRTMTKENIVRSAWGKMSHLLKKAGRTVV